MKNVSIFLSIALLIVAILFYYRIKIITANYENQLEKKEKFWSTRVKVINTFARVAIESDNLPINKTVEVTNLHNIKKPLFSFVEDTPKLVFAIPEGVCNVCHESVFKHFLDLSGKIGTNNILILVPKTRLREAQAEFSNRNISASIYGVSSDEMSLSVGKGSVPFFFILDKDMICKNIFVPNANNATMTSVYFHSVKERFFLDKIAKN